MIYSSDLAKWNTVYYNWLPLTSSWFLFISKSFLFLCYFLVCLMNIMSAFVDYIQHCLAFLAPQRFEHGLNLFLENTTKNSLRNLIFDNTLLALMVCLHNPTSRQTQRRGQIQIPINLHRTQWESVLMFVSEQYEHFHIILYDPFFISLCISLGLEWCEHTISPLVKQFSMELMASYIFHHTDKKDGTNEWKAKLFKVHFRLPYAISWSLSELNPVVKCGTFLVRW